LLTACRRFSRISAFVTAGKRGSGTLSGNFIHSGTRGSVGPVVPGDVMERHIDGLPNLSVKMV
jgi:hypothetical protein